MIKLGTRVLMNEIYTALDLVMPDLAIAFCCFPYNERLSVELKHFAPHCYFFFWIWISHEASSIITANLLSSMSIQLSRHLMGFIW
jgi:hypothetical protein